MAKCDLNCLNCIYEDCINDHIPASRPEYGAQYYQAHKEEVRARKKKQYNERKAAGICVSCGKRKAVKGRVRCLDCQQKARRQDTAGRRRRGMLPKDHFDGVDWCRLCGKEKPVEGKQLCSKCLEISRASIAYARTFIDRDKQRNEGQRLLGCNKSREKGGGDEING